MNKIHCISYASNHFLKRKETFLKQSEKLKKFDFIKVFSENDLDEEFVEKYQNILKMPRGGGYWIWKSQIIKQTFDKIDHGDILIYADVGCSFNDNIKAKNEFDWYIDFIKKNSFLRFDSGHKEKKYSNTKTIDFFSKKYNISYDKLSNSNQLMATIMGFIKNEKTIDFINQYLLFLEEDSLLITDFYNNINPCDEFIDHRHDQSLFSLLYKSLKYELAVIDHTWSRDFNNCKNVPIISTRLRN